MTYNVFGGTLNPTEHLLLIYGVYTAGGTLSTDSQSSTMPMTVDGKRLVSEAEWQLLHREVCLLISFIQFNSTPKVLHKFSNYYSLFCYL